jgi:hypothetical protein
VAQTMYTHASKCKNDKIKGEKKKKGLKWEENFRWFINITYQT